MSTYISPYASALTDNPERTRDAIFLLFTNVFGYVDELEDLLDYYMKTANPIDLGAIIPILPRLASNKLLAHLDLLDTAQVFAFFTNYVLPWARTTAVPSTDDVTDDEELTDEDLERSLTQLEGSLGISDYVIIKEQKLLGLLLKRSAAFSLDQEHAIVERVFAEGTSPDLNQTRELAHALLDTWKTARLLAMIRALLDAGVSSERIHRTGLNAVQIAEFTKQQVVASFIAEYTADSPSTFHTTFDAVMDRTRYLCQTFARKVSSEDLERLMQAALEEGSLLLLWALTSMPELSSSSSASRSAAAAAAGGDGDEFLRDNRFTAISYDFDKPNSVTGEYPLMTLMYRPDGTPRPDPRGMRILMLKLLLSRGVHSAVATNPVTGQPENLLMRVITDSNLLAMFYLAAVPEMATFVVDLVDSPLKRIVDWYGYKWRDFLVTLFPPLARSYSGGFLSRQERFPAAIVQRLLRVGANPNLIHPHPEAPDSLVPILSECVRHRFHRSVHLLLQAGANPNVRGLSPSTLLEIALTRQRDAKAAYLANQTLQTQDQYESWTSIVQDLLKFGASAPPGEEENMGLFLMRMWNAVRNFELPDWKS